MNRFRRAIRRFDLPTFVFSLVLATLLWAYIDDRRVEVKEFEIPLAVRVPAGWEPQGPLPDTVHAILQGPKEVMKSLSGAALEVTKRIEQPTTADTDSHFLELEVKPGDLPLPPGIEVVELRDAKRSLTLIRLVPEYVRITPVIIGAPAAGYRRVNAYADPNTVRVLVPKGTVKPGDALETYPIDITAAATTIYQPVGIRPAVLNGRWIQPEADANVTVIIDPLPQTRQVENVPVRFLYGPLLGLRVTRVAPDKVAVTVKGPQAEVEKLQPADVVVYADSQIITGEVQGTHTLRLKVHLPAGLTLDSVAPADAAFTVEYRLSAEPGAPAPVPAEKETRP